MNNAADEYSPVSATIVRVRRLDIRSPNATNNATELSSTE
jgi:hypothetical protein